MFQKSMKEREQSDRLDRKCIEKKIKERNEGMRDGKKDRR